jgi:predicted nuclease of predicted toxin-antitoxin system
MKFHTDENVAAAVAVGLQRRRIDVTSTPQAGLLGADDETQIAHCRNEKRVLVSHDPDMLRLAASGVEHAGIVYCHIRKYKKGPLIEKLLQLASRFRDEGMKNRIEYL